MNYCDNNLSLRGKNWEIFEKTVNDLDAHTQCEFISLGECQLYHVIKNNAAETQLTMQNFDRLDLVAVLTGKERIPRVRGDYQSLLDSVSDSVSEDEIIETSLNNVIVTHKKKIFFMGKDAIISLNERVGIQSKNMSTHSVLRTLNLDQALKTKEKVICQFIYRTDGMYRKVMYCGTMNFQYIPDTVILNLVKHYKGGNLILRYYEITQKTTKVFFDFDEDVPGDYKPGIMIQNSSFGNSLFSIRGIWSKDTSYIVQDQIDQMHQVGWTEKKTIQKMNERVMNDRTSFVKKMEYLKKIPLFSEKMSELAMRERLHQLLVDTKKALQLTKLNIPTREYSKIRSNWERDYANQKLTAYDLVSLLCSLPDLLVVAKPQAIDNLRKKIFDWVIETNFENL
jgi:hypothetical protein